MINGTKTSYLMCFNGSPLFLTFLLIFINTQNYAYKIICLLDHRICLCVNFNLPPLSVVYETQQLIYYLLRRHMPVRESHFKSFHKYLCLCKLDDLDNRQMDGRLTYNPLWVAMVTIHSPSSLFLKTTLFRI